MIKTKINTRTKYYTIILTLSFLLIGCTPNPIIIERNITVEKIVYNNTIEYINITTPCNITCPTLEDCPSSGFNREYTLSLIRRVKFLEGRQDLYWNNSECSWELNKSNVELKECEEELCDNWNSSWC